MRYFFITGTGQAKRPQSAFYLVVLFTAILGGGCGGGVSAPKTPDGSPVEIAMLFDANIDPNAENDVESDHEQVADFMEKDLTKKFIEGGYHVTTTKDVTNFEPGRGKFLLTVKITEYVPASATDRIEAGFGPGTTAIDTYSELFKDNHTIPSFRLKKGHVSAMKWQVCATEVTENIAAEISRTINELL
jgi:hypothetical protein